MGDESSKEYVTPRLARWRRWTNGPLLIIAIGSMPFLLLEMRHDELSNVDEALVWWINVVVLIVFAVDYVVELSLARRRGLYVRSEWSSPLIVLTQALALLPGLGARRAVFVRGFAVVGDDDDHHRRLWRPVPGQFGWPDRGGVHDGGWHLDVRCGDGQGCSVPGP